jgi:type IV secretory pathway TrbD component
MTHLGFIAASFGLAVLVPAAFGVLTWQRLTVARRRLAALDPRASR